MPENRELRKIALLISTKRIELYQAENKYGLDHPDVLKISQKMDELILQWYRLLE